MNYLDFVEEYRDQTDMSQFDKIRVLASRAKDLYDGKSCLMGGMKNRKPTSQSQIEIKKGLITPNIMTEDPHKDDAADIDEAGED